MSKRNVAYIKPQEPSFLTRLKQQAGYKEGPTVETKREALPEYNDDDDDDGRDEDQPVVVVLKPGDLSAEQAADIAKQQQVKKANEPARLDERIIFRKPNKEGNQAARELSDSLISSDVKKRSSDSVTTKSKKQKCSTASLSTSKSASSSLLSFDENEDDDQDV